MSLESVFAALGGFLTLGETLSYTELFGCFCILSAAVLCSLFEDNPITVIIKNFDLDLTDDSTMITESSSDKTFTEMDDLHDDNFDDKMPFKIPTLASITGRESSHDYSIVDINDNDDNCESKI